MFEPYLTKPKKVTAEFVTNRSAFYICEVIEDLGYECTIEAINNYPSRIDITMEDGTQTSAYSGVHYVVIDSGQVLVLSISEFDSTYEKEESDTLDISKVPTYPEGKRGVDNGE